MTPTKEPPKPPDSLSTAAKKQWKDVVGAFVLEPHHERLLAKALEQWDRAEQARKVLEVEGLTCLDRFEQLRPHPCVAIERQAAMAYQRLMRELGLDIEPPAASRGPRRPGTRE